MDNPKPQHSGLGGVGVGIMTYAADKLNLLSTKEVYVLLLIGIGLIVWSWVTYVLQAVKRTETRDASMLPIIGMIVASVAFAFFFGW